MILLEIFGQSPIQGPGTGSFTDHLIEIVVMLLAAFLLGLWAGRVAVSRLKRKLKEANGELDALNTEVEAMDDRKLEIISLNEKVRLLEERNSKLRIESTNKSTVVDTSDLDQKLKDKDLKIDQLNKDISDLKKQLEAKLEIKTPIVTASKPVEIKKPEVKDVETIVVKTENAEVEVKVDTPKVKPLKVSAPAPEVKSNTVKDDLKKIEGVGPKIQQLLNDDGVLTFDDVIKAGSEKIREILLKAGPQYKVHDPSTWGEQSQLAKDGKWDELLLLQNELKGGKKV